MISDLQDVRAGVGQRGCRIPVEGLAHRPRHVLVDGVVNELVAEHHILTPLAEDAAPEGLNEVGHDVAGRPMGDRCQIANRRGVSQHGREPQHLQGRIRKISKSSHDGLASESGSSYNSRVPGPSLADREPISASVARISRTHIGFPAALSRAPISCGPHGPPSSAHRERSHFLRGQRAELHEVSVDPQVIEELVQLGGPG